MKKKELKNVEFSLSYYPYSDHATKAYYCVIDHNHGSHSYYTIDLSRDERNKVWNLAVCNGKEQARAELKRIFRSRIRKHNSFINYAFVLEDGNNYVYCKEVYAESDTTISKRLEVFKRQKETFEKMDWTYTEPEITEANIVYTANGVKADNVKTKSPTHKINKDWCVIRRFRYKDFYDEMRECQTEEKKKQEEHIKHVKQGISNLLYNLDQIKRGEAGKYYDDIPKWEASNKRRLAEYAITNPVEYAEAVNA